MALRIMLFGKSKMTDILTDLSLIKYLDQNTPALTSDHSNQTVVNEWNEKDQKALSTIRLHVGSSPLVYIAGANHQRKHGPP